MGAAGARLDGTKMQGRRLMAINWWSPYCSYMIYGIVISYGVPGSASYCEWIIPGTHNI